MTDHYTLTNDDDRSTKTSVISKLRSAIEDGTLGQFEATLHTCGLEGKFAFCYATPTGYIKVSLAEGDNENIWTIANMDNDPFSILKSLSFEVQAPAPTPNVKGLERIKDARDAFTKGYYSDSVTIGAIDYACVIPVVTKSEVIAMIPDDIDGYALIWFDGDGDAHNAYGNIAKNIIDCYGYTVGYLLPKKDARNVSYPPLNQ